MFEDFKASSRAYAKVLLFGSAGVGKTVFALSHPGKGYLIDTEGGADHYAQFFPNVKVLRTTQFKEILNALKWLENNAEKDSFLVIDSETMLWDALQYARATYTGAETSMKQLNLGDWGVIKRIIKNIHQIMSNLDMDVIAIAHEKAETDSSGGVIEYIPDTERNVPYYFDIVMRLVRLGEQRRLEILKKRVATIATGEVFDITYQTWGEVFEGIFPSVKRSKEDIIRDWRLKTIMVENKNAITRLVKELENTDLPKEEKEAIKQAFRERYNTLSKIKGAIV